MKIININLVNAEYKRLNLSAYLMKFKIFRHKLRHKLGYFRHKQPTIVK